MTKSDIANLLYDKIGGFTRAESAKYVDITLDLIRDSLMKKNTVKLSGFGTFSTSDKKKRIGRNPKTGEKMDIEARTIVVFKPSQIFRKTIN